MQAGESKASPLLAVYNLQKVLCPCASYAKDNVSYQCTIAIIGGGGWALVEVLLIFCWFQNAEACPTILYQMPYEFWYNMMLLCITL